MSAYWLEKVWQSAFPRAQRERLLLLALADLAGPDDDLVQTSLVILSRMCRMTPRSVLLLLEVLERAGFIERVDRSAVLMYRLSPGRLGEACA